MWGWSGGGAHALACAALLPDLVAAAASLAAVAPYGADGLDYFAGMGQDNADYYRLLLTDEDAARAQTDKDREGLLAASASDVAQGFASMSAPVDVAVLQGEGEMAAWLAYAIHDGLALGSQGYWDDSRAHLDPWGSSWATSLSPCCSCTAGRTTSFPSGMASGWPPISPGSKPGCSITTGT